jgi:4-diphosphocytidyl-2-C-methyl-D-erythritol kinase
MSPVTRPAHAKLNAFLRVLGPRGDGFHEIQTAILPIELHDVVTVEEYDVLLIEVMGERAEELEGAGGESLVGRAAHAWASAAGVGAPGARITIEKRIPVAAGLGGGSADAAATILALDELFGTALTPDAVLEVAASVGSDVCALVHGGPVFGDGRGEHVLALHAPTSHWVVCPLPFVVRTPDAYVWWDERPTSGPDPGSLIAAIEVGDHDLAGSALFDDLQPGVAERHPQVARAVAAFGAAGALGAVMSGSGPTVVALAHDPVHAAAIASAVPGSFVTTAPPPASPPRTIAEPSGVV